MSDYYVMTNWGPMKAHKNCSGGSSEELNEIIKGAPEDMDTFAEVYAKYKELQDSLNSMEVLRRGNWLVQETEKLPPASNTTLNSIYLDKDGNSYVTVNKGTEENPVYLWTMLNSDNITAKDTLDKLEYSDVF